MTLIERQMYEEEGDYKIIFMLMIHLYNFRTTNIPINTISNWYMEPRDKYYGYDELSEYANDFMQMN